MKRGLFFCLCASFLFAETDSAPPLPEESVSWRYYHLASVGYRRDRQKFHGPSATVRIEDRNSIELILNSYFEADHFVSYIRGSYGWLIDGNLSAQQGESVFGQGFDFPAFTLGAGYSADVFGAWGLKFPLVKSSSLIMNLIPFGGYRYSHLMNFPKGTAKLQVSLPSPFFPTSEEGFASKSFLAPNQQDWFGLFGELRLQMLFFDSVQWELFYQYHRPSMRSLFKEEVEIFLQDGLNELNFVSFSELKTSYKVDTALKQIGGMNVRYLGSSGYSFGLHVEGAYAFTPKARSILRTKEQRYALSPSSESSLVFDTKAKVTWVTYEASFYLGYEF